MTLIAPTLQAFFTDRLTKQLHASPRTIASYRDSLRLLLCFANDRTGIAPSALDWNDLDEPLIAAFLEHLETDRHNSARTRNLRLTAIRALFRYAALRHPEHAAVIARVLSIPAKRFDPIVAVALGPDLVVDDDLVAVDGVGTQSGDVTPVGRFRVDRRHQLIGRVEDVDLRPAVGRRAHADAVAARRMDVREIAIVDELPMAAAADAEVKRAPRDQR